MNDGASKRLLFTLSAYEYLESGFLASGALERGAVARKTFPDGERYLRLETDPWGRDVVLLGGTPTDLDWLELYDLGCAVSRAGARSLSIVMPYFGYATMERAVKPGEVVTARTRARLVSAIPPCEGGNRVFLFDLHTDGIEFYFGDSHVTHHLYGAPIVTRAIRALTAGGGDYVLGAADAGRAKWVQSLAAGLGVMPAFVYKRRDAATGAPSVTGINADVEGKLVVLYDDMIRTGSSLVQAAEAYRSAGASSVVAIASHLVLPEGALERLRGSGAIDRVLGSNSHPGSRRVAAVDPEAVFDCSELFLRALQRSA